MENTFLKQGQQFINFQNKIKKATLERKKVKEGFETQQQNVILPTNTDTTNTNTNISNSSKQIIKINKMEQKFNHLVTLYKQELQNIQNKLTTNTNVDASSSPLISTDDQLILDNIKTQLAILGNDIATTMESLYTKNNEIYKEMNMNSEQFKKNIEMYKDVNKRLQTEGMTNMTQRDLNSLVSDSDIYVLYENYNYVLWSILAITTITLTMKLLK